MPTPISELETALGKYTHPSSTFLDVLNEVLPSLASRGVWKDLTFERSVYVDRTTNFLTLPEDAASVLYCVSRDGRTPVNPLWNHYLNEGVTRKSYGEWYGVEDAGFVPTKELLTQDESYVLFAMPNFAWGENPDSTQVETLSSVGTGATITVKYKNWEGVQKKTTDTLVDSATPQYLSARAVKDIEQISATGITTPVLVVAVPAKTYVKITNKSSTNFIANKVPGLPFTAEGVTGPALFLPIDSKSTVALDTVGEAVADDLFGTHTNTVSGPLIGAIVPDPDLLHSVLLKQGFSESGKKVAVFDGSETVARYRAFRIYNNGTRLHFLFRKKLGPYAEGDSAPIDNVTALKYALLANTAEYNNEFASSRQWWSAAKKELDAELEAYLGSALPKVNFDPTGGLGPVHSAM